MGLSFADQDFLLNSNWTPEKEEASQDAKNRSRVCLGLKCDEQDPLLSSGSDPPLSFSEDK